MSAVPAFFHYRTKVKEHMMNVRDLIRRIELLMRDERYPPLCIRKVDLNIPSSSKTGASDQGLPSHALSMTTSQL